MVTTYAAIHSRAPNIQARLACAVFDSQPDQTQFRTEANSRAPREPVFTIAAQTKERHVGSPWRDPITYCRRAFCQPPLLTNAGVEQSGPFHTKCNYIHQSSIAAD